MLRVTSSQTSFCFIGKKFGYACKYVQLVWTQMFESCFLTTCHSPGIMVSKHFENSWRCSECSDGRVWLYESWHFAFRHMLEAPRGAQFPMNMNVS